MTQVLGGARQSDGNWLHTGHLVISAVMADGTPLSVTLPDDWSPPNTAALFWSEWYWNTSTTVPPNNGQMRSDTGRLSDATDLRISTRTDTNVDATVPLTSVSSANTLFIQQKSDSRRWAELQCTGPAVNHGGTYISVPVTFLDGANSDVGGNTTMLMSVRGASSSSSIAALEARVTALETAVANMPNSLEDLKYGG